MLSIATILIALFGLVLLITLHELGHFLMARYFNVKVDEFGIGIPPRVWGKQVGETLYSINLLPLGGFVRLEGEDSSVKGPRSFSEKPVAQRLAIVAAGVVMFWIISAVIFTGLALTSGIPSAVPDDMRNVNKPMVRVFSVVPDSPAFEAGILPGDIIMEVGGAPVTTVDQLIFEVESKKGKETSIITKRGRNVEEITLVPRVQHKEGALGVQLGRVALVKSLWWEAPLRGIELTADMTWRIVGAFGTVVASLLPGREMPDGVSIMGPIGIVSALQDSLFLGIPHFLFFLSLLSLHLAVINILPIPALDGGRIAFLLVEGARGKAAPEQVEKVIHTAFFILLILLLLFITIQDISSLFS
ncbi:MAG: M50 family metallopeptidase [bacterium]|nr:M50 family metallopeptidase [bacterium]